MRLVAVWVEKYMSLENLGFNLGDEIHFKFEFDPIERTLLVGGEKTNDYFDLFNDSKIKNITGIIGNNGAGKTSFLKLLNLFEAKSPIENCAVLIFKDYATGKYIGYNYGQQFKAKKINISKSKELIKLVGDKNFDITISDNPFKGCNILFYSNLYSEHNDGYLKLKNKLNRSVDYLTKSCLNKSAIERYNKKHDKLPEGLISKEAQYNVLKLYFNERFKRLIKFLSIVNTEHQKLKKIIGAIPFPEYLNLNYREDLYEQVNELIERSIYNFKHLRSIIKYSIDSFQKEKNIELRFKRELIFKLFLYAFKDDLFKKTQPNTSLKELESFVNEITLDAELFDRINKYMISKKNQSLFYQITKLNNILNNLTNGTYKIEIKEERYGLFDSYSYKVDVTDDIWNFIKDINELFEVDDEPLISFRWHPLSAGQEAILNQFVQYWEGINNVKAKNLLINIDEGELYLHPEWQRQYIDLIYSFIKYFVDLNSEIETVQIILTSHSPFIVSDLPKFNLVFLQREKANNNQRPKVSILDSQNHQPTFGGNIFDLYKNSFFINGFFGEYSIKWLNEAFLKVKDKNYPIKEGEFKIKDNEQLQAFIQIIGEKVVRDVLQSQLSNKSHSDKFEIINLTERAEKKLAEFDKEKNLSKGGKAKPQ